MRLFIVRHGETVQNAQGLIQGQLEGELSPRGLAESQALARRLINETIDYAYCSDLQRAKETMAEILRFLPVKCEYTAALRELSFGVLEGQPVSVYVEALKARDKAFAASAPQGGESYNQLQARTDFFLKGLVGRHSSHAVLVCAHGWNARCITASLLDLSFDQACALQFANASLSCFELDGNLKALESVLNDTAHLR